MNSLHSGEKGSSRTSWSQGCLLQAHQGGLGKAEEGKPEAVQERSSHWSQKGAHILVTSIPCQCHPSSKAAAWQTCEPCHAMSILKLSIFFDTSRLQPSWYNSCQLVLPCFEVALAPRQGCFHQVHVCIRAEPQTSEDLCLRSTSPIGWCWGGSLAAGRGAWGHGCRGACWPGCDGHECRWQWRRLWSERAWGPCWRWHAWMRLRSLAVSAGTVWSMMVVRNPAAMKALLAMTLVMMTAMMRRMVRDLMLSALLLFPRSHWVTLGLHHAVPTAMCETSSLVIQMLIIIWYRRCCFHKFCWQSYTCGFLSQESASGDFEMTRPLAIKPRSNSAVSKDKTVF